MRKKSASYRFFLVILSSILLSALYKMFKDIVPHHSQFSIGLYFTSSWKVPPVSYIVFYFNKKLYKLTEYDDIL